jgi:hypothetical protein
VEEDAVAPKTSEDPLKKMPEPFLAATTTKDEPCPILPEIAFQKETDVVNLLDDILGEEQLDQLANEAREDEMMTVMKET